MTTETVVPPPEKPSRPRRSWLITLPIGVVTALVIVPIWTTHIDNQRKQEFEQALAESDWSYRLTDREGILNRLWTAEVPFGFCPLKVEAPENQPKAAVIVFDNLEPTAKIPITQISPEELLVRQRDYGVSQCNIDSP